MADSVKGRRTLQEKLRRLVIVLAVGYPIALLLVLAIFRGIGERVAIVTVALYLPAAGFGLPLPVLTLALLFVRPRRWLLTQLVAALILLFPVMGLHLHGARASAAGAARLRVMSCNIDLASASFAALGDAIRSVAPDIALLQEAPEDEAGLLAPQLPGYFVRADGQFLVASKYPITDVYLPPQVHLNDENFDANFVRYRVSAPGGVIDVYNAHPFSPHSQFDRLRGGGLMYELASGRFFTNHEAFRRLARNSGVRLLQARAMAAHAGKAPFPVLIGGDTNLPSNSWILGQTLGGYQDGFAEVGRGFGYTFPSRHAPPWLRLDRVLADESFRFLAFSRVNARVSKHFPVFADLERVTKNP